MGVSVLNLGTGDAVAEMPWNGQVLHITWDPSKYTPESEEAWIDLENDPETGFGPLMVTFISDCVTAWDLKGDVDETSGKLIETDTPFPLEPAKLKKIPVEFLGAVMVAIRESASPKETRNENSDAG